MLDPSIGVARPYPGLRRSLADLRRLLEGSELYRSEAKNQDTLAKFGHGTPDDWIERNLYSRFNWQGVGLMLIIDLLLFGAIGLSEWAVQMLWIPVTAAGFGCPSSSNTISMP